MATEDILLADYQRTSEIHKTLVDVRFRLLALVPTVAAAAFALLKNGSSDKTVGVASIGLTATLAVAIYEMRNTQLHDAAVHRLKEIEGRLNLPPSVPGKRIGGVMRERPSSRYRIGRFAIYHDFALFLAYGSSLGAWYYLLSTSLWGSWEKTQERLLTAGGTALLIVLFSCLFFTATKPRGLTGHIAALPKPPDDFESFLDRLTESVRQPYYGSVRRERNLFEDEDAAEAAKALRLTEDDGKQLKKSKLETRLTLTKRDLRQAAQANERWAITSRKLHETLLVEAVGYREVEQAVVDLRSANEILTVSSRLFEPVERRICRLGTASILRPEQIAVHMQWIKKLMDHCVQH